MSKPQSTRTARAEAHELRPDEGAALKSRNILCQPFMPPLFCGRIIRASAAFQPARNFRGFQPSPIIRPPNVPTSHDAKSRGDEAYFFPNVGTNPPAHGSYCCTPKFDFQMPNRLTIDWKITRFGVTLRRNVSMDQKQTTQMKVSCLTEPDVPQSKSAAERADNSGHRLPLRRNPGLQSDSGAPDPCC